MGPVAPRAGGSLSAWDTGRSVLDGLLAPLRVPALAAEALDSLVQVARDVGTMRSELIRVREQTEPMSDLLPALERLEHGLSERLDSLHQVATKLEEVESDLDGRVGELLEEMTGMHETVAGLQDDVQRVTDRMPDPDEPGPLGKARLALTGNGAA